MAFRYTSLEDGQVIVRDGLVDYLEGLARWVRTEDADSVEPKSAEPVAEVADEKSAQPALDRPNVNDSKAEWLAYAKSLGHTDAELQGLTTAKIKALVGA